ncbi:MAG: hypothetical protein ACT4N4_17120 [Rhodospirillales bacterium]
MTGKPTLSKSGAAALSVRRRREAAALRANLARRKQRARALEGDGDKSASPPEALDSKPPAPKDGGA